MTERDPIDLIRDQLGKAETMGSLHADHEVFKQWQSETKTILEKAFSPKSVHCQSFVALRFREISVKSFASPGIDKINAARYKRDLENAKNVLHGAIKELTLDRTLFISGHDRLDPQLDPIDQDLVPEDVSQFRDLDVYLRDRQEGTTVSRSTMVRTIARLGFTRKKSPSLPRNATPNALRPGAKASSRRSEPSPLRVWYLWTKPARTRR